MKQVYKFIMILLLFLGVAATTYVHAQVYAGADEEICASEASYTIADALDGGYATITWTTSGDGSFDSNSIQNPTYTPGANDWSTGSVVLTLEGTDQVITSTDEMTLTLNPLPEITDLTLDYSTDEVSWSDVGGNKDDGFQLCIDPDNTYYYLDVNTFTSNPELASSVNNAFYLNTGSLPGDFYIYWDDKGVNAGASGTWQEHMYDIITGSEPIFYLYFNGSDYVLYDGLQKDYFSTDATLRVNGDYPVGNYTFDGTIEDVNGCIDEYSFDMLFQQVPVADAGEDDTVCSDTYNLDGSGSEYYSSVEWSILVGDGNGYFEGNPGQLISTELNPAFTGAHGFTYTLKITVQPVSPCITAMEDEVDIFFQEDPTANAGADATTCEDTPYEIANATASAYSSVLWTGGNGSFDNAATVNPTYTPVDADAVAGTITLTLTAEPISPCEVAAFDDMILTVGTAPDVNAGADKNICNIGAFVSGTASNHDGTLWVSYTGGTFNDPTALNTYYHTSLQDRINGTIELTLVAAAQNPCVLPKWDDIILTITQDSPVVFAGDDDTSCENVGYELSDATATNYDALVWVTEGDGTFDDENLLNATYTFGTDDISTGYAILKLVADPISPCTILIEDQMTLYVQEEPEAYAGVDATICENQTYQLTTATAYHYDYVEWYTVVGTGSFSDVNALHPTYTPGLGDIIAGSVELCMAAAPISPCTVGDTDCMTLTIQYLPIANAGADAAICEYETYALSDATAEYYSSVSWETSGDGIFLSQNNPQLPANPLNPEYIPGPGDIANGSVELCLTAEPISPCLLSDIDCMILTIYEEPAVIFAAEGVQFYEGETLEYCYNETITITLDEILKGTAPFDIAWEVNGAPANATNVNVGDQLFSSTMAPDTYSVVITDITDANGCSVQDVSPYNVTVIVHPEPAVLFAFNDTQAYQGSEFTFCEDQTVIVTLDQIVEGSEPFDIEWTVNGTPDSQTDVYLGDELFSSALSPGTYTVQITNITDANGCSISDPSIYTATVFIQALPIPFAGEDAEICEYESYSIDDATAENYSSVSWVTTLGDGSFDNAAQVNPTYTPGTSDILAGSVELCMLLAPIDPCTTGDSDCMTLTIHREPAIIFAANGTQFYEGALIEYCEGDNIEITLDQIVYGTAPFDIEWTVNGTPDSQTGVNLDGVLFSGTQAPGTYDLEITSITDANGCSAQDVSMYYATIEVHPQPALIFAANGNQFYEGAEIEYCEGDNIEVTLDQIVTGTAPFDIEWTVNGTPDSQTGVNLNDVLFSGTQSPGTYDLAITSITDANGCAALEVSMYYATFIVHPQPALIFAANGNQFYEGDLIEYCEGDNIELTLDQIVTGTAPFDIEWTVNGLPDSQTGVNLNDVLFSGTQAPGTYNLAITSISDANGCSALDVSMYYATIEVHPQPALIFAANENQFYEGAEIEYCEGDNIEVTLDQIVTGTAPFDIEWTVNGTPDSQTGVNLYDVLFSGTQAPGTYDLAITSITDANGCSALDVSMYYATFIVHPQPALIFAANGNQFYEGDVIEYCEGDNIEITLDQIVTGTAPFDIEWTVNGSPDSQTGVNLNDVLFSGTQAPGTYDLQITSITDANGCSALDVSMYFAQIVVQNQPALIFAFDGSPFYEGAVFEFCENQPFEVTLDEIVTGTAPFDIEWTVNGTPDSQTGVNVGDVLFSGTMPGGTYNVQITSITDANGCTALDVSMYYATFEVQALPSVDIIPEEATICYGDMFDFTGLVDAANYNAIIWFTVDGNGTFSNEFIEEPMYMPNPTTDYPQGCIEIGVTVAPIDPCTLQDEDFMTLCFQAPPTADAGTAATICEGDTYTLADATAEDYESLSWAGGDGSFDDATAMNPTYTPGPSDISNGFVELCLTAEPIDPCTFSAEDCMFLTINPAPAVLFAFNGVQAYEGSEFEYCFDETVTVTLDQVLIGTQPFDIAWEVNGTPDNATGVNQGDELFSNTLAPGIYTVQITSIVDANGCSPLDLSIYNATVYVIPAPVADAGEDVTICETDTHTLSDANPENYSSLLWSTTGDGSFDDPTSPNPTYTLGEDDIFNESVTLCQVVQPIDPCTMTDEDCMTITIQLAPVAFAGDDATICEDVSYEVLGGVINACGFYWTTSGDGSFDDPNALLTDYNPGANDMLEGQVDLCLTAEACDPCSVADQDCMTLFISQNPTVEITSPLDGAIIYSDPATISGTAADIDGNLDYVEVRVNGGTWMTATGAANWSIDVALEPCFNDIEARAVDTYGCMSEIDMIVVELRAQDIPLIPSWSYISSYLDPIDADIEVIIDNDVTPAGNTVIILNERGKFYWPENGNTLNTWNSYDGYKIKVNTTGELRMRGEPVADQTLDLTAGFHIMPVLTNQLTPINDIFVDPLNDILLIFEIQTNKIYWPGGGLFTLSDLTPGFGYLVNLINPVTATFPPILPCALKDNASYELVQNNGPWALTRTANVHLISIDKAAIAELEDVDFIGAFDTEGTCIGYASVSDGENVLLTVYGDENTTAIKDGAVEGELISFRAYSERSGEEETLTANFDLSMPNYDGNYAQNGLSKINSFMETTTGINPDVDVAEMVQIFPNPANENITISYPLNEAFNNSVKVTFVNAAGGAVKQIELNAKQTQVDVSELQPGVYIMKFENNGNVVIKRLVIR